MAKFVKKTTGLTGLNVAKDPHKHLQVIYGKLVRTLMKFPQESVYRQATLTMTEDRLAKINSEPNVERLEKDINCGQIEEVILQAERELGLARHLLKCEAWKPLLEEAPANQWRWPIN